VTRLRLESPLSRLGARQREVAVMLLLQSISNSILDFCLED
jgi:hypothetical protein